MLVTTDSVHGGSGYKAKKGGGNPSRIKREREACIALTFIFKKESQDGQIARQNGIQTG